MTDYQLSDYESCASQLTLVETLRQTTDKNRKEILQAIKDHLDKIDWGHYFYMIREDLLKSARSGMDTSKSIVNAPQEFDFGGYHIGSKNWNSRDVYRENFRNRLMNILKASGFEKIKTLIDDGDNQYRFKIIFDVSW